MLARIHICFKCFYKMRKPLTSEGGGGYGGEEVAGELELDEVGEPAEGGGVDLADLALCEVEPLEVGEAVAGEDLPGQDLEVVAAQVEHLRLGVDRVGDGDLALALALHPTLPCKPVQR